MNKPPPEIQRRINAAWATYPTGGAVLSAEEREIAVNSMVCVGCGKAANALTEDVIDIPSVGPWWPCGGS